MANPSSVTVQAPAKINLSLAVGPPRGDGYHPLATVYQALGLFDRVTASVAPDGEVALDVEDARTSDHRLRGRDGAVPVGDPTSAGGAEVPTNGRNLAVRAARLLAERTGTEAGARLTLRKAIPVAGGLAGGSSDAAAALVACDVLWSTGLSTDDLLETAAELGSDVPFCLLGGTVVGRGRGEQVEPLPARGRYHWVLAVDQHGLSTPAVYAELDRLRAESGARARAEPGLAEAGIAEPGIADDLLRALRAGDAPALGRALRNDLQSAAVSLRPDLADVLGLGEAVGALASLLSGSGPTCLFLAADEAHAQQVHAGLAAAGVHAVHRATGPVPGARVVHQGAAQ